MIYRLEYCNKYGDTARLDIQRGASTPIEVIEGADNPFSLKYKLDASNKTGYFMSSSAEISIFETATFNIDELKTSNETELKVNYYVNSDLKWTGFILPDFFSRVIGEPAIVEMTATDRLGTLKGVTLTGLTAKVTLRSLLEQSLLKTGISLPVQYDAQISESGTNVFDTEILSQRIVDTRGRNISCYDIIKSILVATNSTIRQRDGKWQIYNKLEHESVAPSITFNEVEKGARRTIQPVASSVGIFQELGGGQIYPDNYNFINGLSDWALGGSSPSFVPENRNVMGYTTGGMPIYGDSGFFSIRGYNSADPVLVTPETNPHIKSNPITIQTNDAASVKVNVDVNATGQNIATNIFTVIVFAEKVGEKLAIDQSGVFTKYSSDINKVGQFYHNVVIYDKGKKNIDAVTVNKQISGVLTADNVNDYKITVLITGTWLSAKTVFINSVATTFSSTVDTTKGNIFKTNQGVNFTREHEIDTTIFGDYIARGINGYFYKYMPDDTSSLMLTDGSFTDLWTAFGSSEQLPLLQHMTRQKSKMFSIAHDILSATIEAQSFDPLAIYQSCDGEKWVIIEANYDFLRSKVDIVLEQIKYGSLEKRDFIYSYFGEGETGVKSIGGISSGTGGGGSGGGMTAEQIELLNTVAGYWTLDEDGNLKTTYNAYSEQELSAYGIGSGGSSGGDVYLLQAWTDYDATKDNWAVKAGLLVPFYNDTRSRLTSLEGGAALSLSPVGSGNGIASITKSGTVLTVTKANFAELDVNGKILSSQLPSYVGDVLEYVNLAAFPATGETGKIYIAQDTNKIYRWSGTAYVEISASLFDDLFEKVEVSTGVFAIKAKYSFYSTGEVSAYGIGSGGSSGGSYDRLDAWADYDSTKSGWVLSALLGVDLNTRVGNLEGGSALTVNTTGTGNAITSISKAGTVITATKGATFSLSNHLHTGVYEPVFTKNTAFNKNFGTTSGTVAQGNDSRINNGQTAYGWGNHASAGYALNSSLSNYLPLAGGTLTGNVTAPTFIGALSGNASSATKLQTARTIWGQSFDGTGNVTGALTSVTDITASGTIQSLYGKFTNLTTNYLPKQSSYGLVNSLIYDNGTNVGINGKLSATNSISSESVNEGVATFYNSYNNYDVNPTISYPVLSLIRTGKSGSTYSSVFQIGISRWSASGSFANTQTDFKLSNGNTSFPDITVMSLRSNGNVGIGTTSPSQKLHVAGNILATGEITAYVASDRRLKENIKPIISALDYINKLNPVSYNWNARAKELNSNKPNSLDYGLIAQEVETVLPGVVHGIFDDKYKSIDYIKLIPILIAAIKELKQKVNKL